MIPITIQNNLKQSDLGNQWTLISNLASGIMSHAIEKLLLVKFGWFTGRDSQ